MQKHLIATLDHQRFASAEEAQAACEKHAEGYSCSLPLSLIQ